MSITELFASEFLRTVVLRALVVGLLVSLCSSMLGVSLVLKRYSMIGDGLSHVGFFALAVASVAGVGATYSLEVSVPIVILAAVLIAVGVIVYLTPLLLPLLPGAVCMLMSLIIEPVFREYTAEQGDENTDAWYNE